ncbi:hypothetical protein HRI97_02185 [Treponema socranskii subsp. buccale]|uniref:hypothetical protein n=1 Tax=Treponema socranskii TaxID=53419 RepID=UPI0020A46898|nr:hypothetical protein [Treponema socranskii]UTD01954.1 hypothetical protein HRI97_02185 [Treponema socranskii subsp. buccale]
MIHKKSFTAAALAAVFLLAGCQQNAETPAQPPKDTTAPAEVANFTATPGSASVVILSWKNPADDDLYQVEITANPAHGSLKNAIYLAAEKGKDVSYSADGLRADTNYIFTVKTVDTSLNKSAGAVKKLYDDPVITKIAIPRAGISYGGNVLPVTIVGKNFTAPGISAADFSGTGATFSNFKVISDVKATAEVSCPNTAGEHIVTVHCKGASKTGMLSVKDYTGWDPGKIVLADNTVVDKDGYTAIDSANPPVAVVYKTNAYGGAIGVALHRSHLPWAKRDTRGYNTKFEGIICTPSRSHTSGAAAWATFTGDTGGSDNWDYICSVDPVGAANAAVNYPAFDWVNTYNETYKSKLGAARPAWYMPSIAELSEVYKNKDTVNASLLKIKGINGAYADANLETGWFWSSSQFSNNNYYAWLAEFGSGTFYYSYKYYDYDVCCIAGF